MVEPASPQADGVPKYLLEAGFITADQAGAAATRQKASGERFTMALVLGGSVAGDDLLRGLSRRNGEEVIEVDGHALHPRLVHLIPEPVAFEQKLLPIHRVRNVLFAAVPAPLGPLGRGRGVARGGGGGIGIGSGGRAGIEFLELVDPLVGLGIGLRHRIVLRPPG